MIEEHSEKSEKSRILSGLNSAITAVNLGMEGRTREQSEYARGGRKTLDTLANPESLIHRIYTHELEEHGDIIEKARNNFPQEESLNYLQKLLDIYSY